MSTRTAPGGQMTLIEHLAELRRRIIISILAIGAGGLVVTIFYNQILDLLVDPYCTATNRSGDACNLQLVDPTEGLGIRFKLTAYGGIAIAMPVILWQIWKFVSPGLYDNEKRYAWPFVTSALGLFMLGAGLAYWTMPKALQFLNTIGGQDFEVDYRPGPYITLIAYMMLAFGAGFEFPILLVFLMMAGIVEPATLRKYRRHAIVITAIVVAVITPSGDPISMLALTIPMVVFYEIAILIGSWFKRRQAQQVRR